MNSRSNLIQDNFELAVREVAHFRDAGGHTLVDQTTVGIGPKPKLLAELSKVAGISIVAGTGFYVAGSYPGSVSDMSVSELVDHLRSELLGGINHTAVRAGLIGELGLSAPLLPFERRLLTAAGIVQSEFGCAISIHTPWGVEEVKMVAHAALSASLDPNYTALCHLDNRFRTNLQDYLEMYRLGFYLSLDCFGRDCYYPHLDTHLPSDAERIEAVRGLIDAGAADRVLLSQDICFQHELAANDGHGYGHILRDVVPRMMSLGVREKEIHQMLALNPQKWLAGGL
jgi:phosphotriesterase-related protein